MDNNGTVVDRVLADENAERASHGQAPLSEHQSSVLTSVFSALPEEIVVQILAYDVANPNVRLTSNALARLSADAYITEFKLAVREAVGNIRQWRGQTYLMSADQFTERLVRICSSRRKITDGVQMPLSWFAAHGPNDLFAPMSSDVIARLLDIAVRDRTLEKFFRKFLDANTANQTYVQFLAFIPIYGAAARYYSDSDVNDEFSRVFAKSMVAVCSVPETFLWLTFTQAGNHNTGIWGEIFVDLILHMLDPSRAPVGDTVIDDDIYDTRFLWAFADWPRGFGDPVDKLIYKERYGINGWIPPVDTFVLHTPQAYARSQLLDDPTSAMWTLIASIPLTDEQRRWPARTRAAFYTLDGLSFATVVRILYLQIEGSSMDDGIDELRDLPQYVPLLRRGIRERQDGWTDALVVWLAALPLDGDMYTHMRMVVPRAFPPNRIIDAVAKYPRILSRADIDALVAPGDPLISPTTPLDNGVPSVFRYLTFVVQAQTSRVGAHWSNLTRMMARVQYSADYDSK